MPTTPTTASGTKKNGNRSSDQSLVRLNVNLNAETAAALRELAEERDISFTEAVRRAISVYKYMNDEKQAGRHIQTTNADRGDVRELLMM
jgi:hypothetical protein